MKITPLGGTGIPGAGAVIAPTSQDRKAAAVKAFNGESNVTMTPSDTPIDPQLEAQQLNVRKIKMNTNASPDRIEDIQEQIPNANEEQTSIPDTIDQTKTTEVTKPLSPQFAALAKQRRALQVKEAELAAKEKALGEIPKGIDLSRLKAEPLSVLQEAGVTYEQLTEAILANPSGANAEVQALRNEIKALKEGIDNNLNERDQQAEQQVLKELRRAIDKMAFSGDEFENIREEGAQAKVVELIHRTWKKTGEVMDEHEAAKFVENFLIEENEKRAKRKSIMSRLTPQQEQMAQPRAQGMKTLTNRDTAHAPTGRRARALAAFHGNLKK